MSSSPEKCRNQSKLMVAVMMETILNAILIPLIGKRTFLVVAIVRAPSASERRTR